MTGVVDGGLSTHVATGHLHVVVLKTSGLSSRLAERPILDRRPCLPGLSLWVSILLDHSPGAPCEAMMTSRA